MANPRVLSVVLLAALASIAFSLRADQWNGTCEPYPCMAWGTDCQCYQCVPDPASPVCENTMIIDGCILGFGETTTRAVCTGAPPFNGGGGGSGGSYSDPFAELGAGISDCTALQVILEFPPPGIPPDLYWRAWDIFSQQCPPPGSHENQIP